MYDLYYSGTIAHTPIGNDPAQEAEIEAVNPVEGDGDQKWRAFRFLETGSPLFWSMIICHFLGSYCMGSFRFSKLEAEKYDTWVKLFTTVFDDKVDWLDDDAEQPWVAIDIFATAILCIHSLTGFFLAVEVHKNFGTGWKKIIRYRMQGFDKARPLRTLSYVLYFVALTALPPANWVIADAMRVVRLLWFMGESSQLMSTLKTLYWNVDTLGTLFSLLFMVMFVFVIVGREVFSEMKYGEFLRHGSDFTTFYNSFVMLFRLISGDEWNQIARATWVVEPSCTYEKSDGLYDRGGSYTVHANRVDGKAAIDHT